MICISVDLFQRVSSLMLSGDIHNIHSLRFTSGVTPADLLVASMAAELFSSTYLLTGIGGTQNWDLSCCHSQCETRYADSLPTELCRLRFTYSSIKYL